MATPAWNVSGQYYETCNCDFVCPCVPGQLAVRPATTKGDCQFAMAFQIERGSYGAMSLDGLGFIVLGDLIEIDADRGAEDLSDAVRRNARLVGFLDVTDPGVLRNRNAPTRR